MSGPIEKEGYLQKFSKGLMGEKWKRCFVTLYKDGSFFWFKKKSDPTSSGNCSLKNVAKYLAVGAYARTLPKSPELPSNGKVDHLVAFPEEPKKGAKIHFFLADNDDDFNSWMKSMHSVLPPPPGQPMVQEPPVVARMANSMSAPLMPGAPAAGVMAPPITGTGCYPSQSNPTHAPYQPQPPHQPLASAPSGGAIGFDAITATSACQQGAGIPRPYTPYGPPQADAYRLPPPQQPLGQVPTAIYPQVGYPQQPYQPGFPQQSNPHPNYYPQQPQYGYPQQPQQAYQQPYGYQQPPSTGFQYGQAPRQPYAQHPQTIVVKQKKNKSPGTGKMLAGMAGGAAAGYMAGRMMGGGPFGWGGGGGWGCGGGWGSWSSGSWGSWSSCGSFGSFGSFD